MELWDAYTMDGERTGGTLVRGQPIPDGLYHLVCEVLVRHRDGSYLAMKRWHKKEDYPGWWETTAGGSALQGEDMWACVRREMKEETGLDGEEFTHIACRITADDHVIFHSFLCTVDCDKDSVTLQEGETEAYRWLTEQEFVEFVNSGNMIPTQKRRLKKWLVEMGYLRKTVVEYGCPRDMEPWMELVRSVRWNFPGLETEEALQDYRNTVLRFMGEKRALCVKAGTRIVGILLFSKKHNMICCLAVDPEYREMGIASALLKKALSHLDGTKDITVTTFRENDKKGTAPRALYTGFGFQPGVLCEEFGYPTQEFVLKGEVI